jgi:hypothetical protein
LGEERLDPRLAVGGARAAEVPGDARADHEGRGGLGGHLRAVVGDRQQHRQPVVVIRHDPAAQLGEQVLLAVGDQRVDEGDLDLGGGLLRGHDRG